MKKEDDRKMNDRKIDSLPEIKVAEISFGQTFPN